MEKLAGKNKGLAVISICFALSGMTFHGAGAWAESIGETSGINSVIGVSPSTDDFVKEAAISDRFEIQSSQLAVTRVDAMTKAFAERMIADHEKTSGELKALIQSGKVETELPDRLDSAHQDMLDKLKDLQGSEFTQQYHDDQANGHKDAVSLFRRYAKGGDNPVLKDWAAKTLPALKDHLKSANVLGKHH